MPVNVRKKIELAANVAIIVVAVLLATVLVKNHLVTNQKEVVGNRSRSFDAPALSAFKLDCGYRTQTLVTATRSTQQDAPEVSAKGTKCHYFLETNQSSLDFLPLEF